MSFHDGRELEGTIPQFVLAVRLLKMLQSQLERRIFQILVMMAHVLMIFIACSKLVAHPHAKENPNV